MTEQEKELSVYYRDLKRKIVNECIKIVETNFEMEREHYKHRPLNEQTVIGNNYNVIETDLKNTMKELIK